jgi:hypothetical protein
VFSIQVQIQSSYTRIKEEALLKQTSSLRVWVFALAAVLIASIPGQGWAQVGATGAIAGVVTDPADATVQGVKVTAQEKTTGVTREATSDGQGRYRLSALPVGEYSVTFESQGFRHLVRQGVQVEAAVTRALDVQLTLGEISQHVTVTEDAPLISTTQSTTFRQINTLELLEVPSSTRNFTHLLAAEAGVNADLPQVLGNDTGSLSPSVNGLRTTSNSLQFNGIDSTNLLSNEGSLVENIAPAPETIQEVKLQTSLYDASTGRNGGGNFQIVTKGGSNEFHGSAYWFLQNEALNANDFFFNRDGIDRPEARRNEGGFTIGGPIRRDRAFFFGSYQRTQALTAFVPTGSSLSDLPLFLDFLTDRSVAGIQSGVLGAINQARAACGLAPLASVTVSSVGANVFALRNPATGGFVIPAPNFSGGCPRNSAGLAITDSGTTGNPMARIRQVFPSEFTQDQFNLRGDMNVTSANRLYGVFFFSNFPSLDSFPDPSSLASPFVLQRHNRARTLAVGNTHVFNPRLINEARFGFLSLNNTRGLDDPFLDDSLTSAALGITNPALLFDDSPGTRRLGHFIFRGPRFSFGGPNDSFNKRKQMTYNVNDTVSYHRGSHSWRFGAEYRHNNIQNNLPEEQATEFEKIPTFTSLLAGLTPEADTQFGVTGKEFRSHDISWFAADDWKIGQRLTLNLGVRWDWFGWPTEKNGLIGNFDPTIADTENPISGFLIPDNVSTSGLLSAAQTIIDPAVAATTVISNGHTLRGQDLNNFQPRVGFAWQPLNSNRLVVRGGYGMFYDRPSAAFINTVFSNYPFLREVEVTFPSNNVPIATAFSQQNTSLPLNMYVPMRVVFRSNNYEMRDNTGVTFGADGTTANPNCEAGPNIGLPPGTNFSAGGPCSGNVAETFEFRAVDRNLRTPYIQQWNLGWQWEVAKDYMLEVRYVGTKGTRLLNALALAQSWDLNSADAPDSVFQRLNDAYVRGNSPRGALGSQTLTPQMMAACGNRTACLQGVGLAYGFNWPTGTGVGNQDFGPLAGVFDMNLALTTVQITNNTTNAIIPFEPRAVFLGLNVPEAIILKSTGNSIYHGLQTNFTKRFSRGLQFNLGYAFSRSIDDSSADPGSTSGGGKPDIPNTGFIVQGDSRNTAANRGVSDFDRTHRFSLSFVYDLPTGGMNNQFVKGWQISGFTQAQSGAPYSIFTGEPEGRSAAALVGSLPTLCANDPTNPLITDYRTQCGLNNGPGGLFRLGFGRPNLASGATLSSLTSTGDQTIAFDISQLASSAGTFGALPRNILRAENQKRFDFAISKSTRLTERFRIEFRTEFFNLFNNVNFALPVNDLQDSSVGQIENTIGGPRVIQFGFRFIF